MRVEKCDACGREGKVTPQMRPVLIKECIHVEVPDPNNPGQVINQPVEIEKPKTKTVMKQCPFTRKMMPQEEAEMEYLETRIIPVGMWFGHGERIDREFCSSCLEKIIEPLKKAWKTIEGFEPK